MENLQNRNRICVIALLNLAILIQSAQARASDENRSQAPYAPYGAYAATPVTYVPVLASGREYYYNNGSFYRRLGDIYLAAPAPVGAVVRTIPAEYKPIVIDGASYYIIHGNVYMQTLNGYQVMPQKPFMIEKYASEQKDAIGAPMQATYSGPKTTEGNSEESYVVNIPNSNGSYVPVIIKKSRDGYTGPHGEYYQKFPKVEELKSIYAK